MHTPRAHNNPQRLLVWFVTCGCIWGLWLMQMRSHDFGLRLGSSLRKLKQLSSLPDANATGPFTFPRIIHQTIPDVNSLTCAEIDNINTWRLLNPDFKHILYDDSSMREFVATNYPEFFPLFKQLRTHLERSDLWRYLVLHRLGGVYADVDVVALAPISSWNSEDKHDAAVLVGVAREGYDVPGGVQFEQWTMASIPGHFLFLHAANLVRERAAGALARSRSQSAIFARTGSGVWSQALQDYVELHHLQLAALNTTDPNGQLVGSVRLLPGDRFSQGWREACADVHERLGPKAYTCHQFWGSWKRQNERQHREATPEECRLIPPTEMPQLERDTDVLQQRGYQQQQQLRYQVQEQQKYLPQKEQQQQYQQLQQYELQQPQLQYNHHQAQQYPQHAAGSLQQQWHQQEEKDSMQQEYSTISS